MTDCAIIGSGISGTFAALYFKRFGISNISIFDKSRGVGGRLATRRIENGKFDHVAQYLNIEEIRHVPEIVSLIKNKIIFKWGEMDRYVAEEGMTNISKFLLSDLDVKKEHKLLRINNLDDKIELVFENGETFYSKSIIFSCPIPQTIEIFENSKIEVKESSFNKLKKIEYNPCIVILIEGKTRADSLEEDFGQNFSSGNISWIADNNKKRISERNNFFTVQCSSDFSQLNIDKNYDEIASLIDKDLRNIFTDEYKILSNHKWRYSTPKTFYKNELSIDVGKNIFIGICGDAFTNGKFDGAVKSGINIVTKYLDRYR